MIPHLFFFFLPGASPAALITVPDVVGQDQASAEAEIAGEGLLFAVVTAYSPTVAAGDVISQDPAAGSSVSAGSTVTITVSLGPQPSSAATGGWHDLGTLSERRKRTKRELLEERIEVDAIPEARIEALAPTVKAKVRKAGTVTLRALLGTEKAEAMSVDMLQTELDHIARRTKAERHRQRLMREDEELLLL